MTSPSSPIAPSQGARPASSSQAATVVDAPRPMNLLVVGGLAAGLSLAFIIYVIYRTFLAEDISRGTGGILLGMFGPIYVAGIYGFAYGWERGNVGKAVRLTAIVVGITVAFVVILAVVFVMIAASSKKSGSSSSGSSGSDSDSSGGGGGESPALAGGAATAAGASSGRDYSGRNLLLDAMVVSAGVGDRRQGAVADDEGPAQQQLAPSKGAAVCPTCAARYEPGGSTHFCPHCGARLPA